MSRSPTACMPKPAGWHYKLGWLTLGLPNFWRLSQGGTEFLLRIKFLQEKAENDWVLEDKFDPVRAERKKGRGVVEVTRNTSPGVLSGIDSVFYQNAYLVTAVVYGLYPVRDPAAGAAAKPREWSSSSVPRAPSSSPSMVILSHTLIQEGQLSVSGERMCTILVNRLED